MLGDLLGHGSMAEVFGGFALGDHGFQKPVAIKRLLPELAGNGVFVERLIEGTKRLVGMQHRNIVGVLDLARDGNDVFLIMEFVYGPSLRQLLKLRGARGLSLGVATYIVQSVAEALEYAHRRPGGAIIHGDISPSNLLLTTSGEVCVADFGIARREGGGNGVIEVKSAYMAPEQARGERLTPSSDVFSLGVVLYELICGKHPFGAQVTPDGAPRRVIPPRAVNPRIPPSIEAICRRAIAHDPRERYPSMQELIDALDEARFGDQLHEGAPELAQAIHECSPHAVPRHPGTLMNEQSATMTVRSLLRDPTPARRMPPPLKTPPSHLAYPPPPAPAPAYVPAAVPVPARAVPPIVDSGARASVAVHSGYASAMLEAPPVLPTAPGRPIVPVEPGGPSGGYMVSSSGDSALGAPVGRQPARRHRWMIAILATAAVSGILFAAGFRLVVDKPLPAVAAPAPPAAAPAPAAPAPAPAVAAPAPAVTAPAPSVTPSEPPATDTPGTVSQTSPGEPPLQEEASTSATPDESTGESTTSRKRTPGILRVQTTPWAWVTIGKQKRQTPAAEFKLKPGRYLVRLEFPTLGITETKKVAIESRKTFTLNIDKEDKEDVDSVDDAEE